MNILIAGGAGYIGSVLTPLLLKCGHTVDVVDKLWFGNHLPQEANVFKKDVTELSVDDLKKYETVIFLAGLSNDPMADFSPKLNFIYNEAHPSYLAYIAKQAGVKRFIHGGSCSVYGYTQNKTFTEEDEVSSSYPYGLAKLGGEYSCLKMQNRDFSIIAFRQGTVCGYSPRMRLDLVINTMFMHALNEKIITVNNASIWRPIISVHDVARAYVLAIDADQSLSGIFNIAHGNYTIGHIAECVQKKVKERFGTNVLIKIKNVNDCRNYKVSLEKAERLLGFTAIKSPNDIVDDLSDNYQNFASNDDIFYNIKSFKKMELETLDIAV